MLRAVGTYLLLDGIASLIVYRKQRVFPQSVRVGRTLIGLLLFLGRE